MGLRVSILSGVRAFGVEGLTEWSSVWGEGMVVVPVSGAQYSGEELMKFSGDDVRPVGVGQEVVEGWEGTPGEVAVRTGFTPLAEMGWASGAGFRGKLVS